MDEALTPSHLICGRRLLTLPSAFDTSARIVNSEEQESTTNSLTRRAKYLSSLSDYYWRKWRIDYLTNIRELYRSSSKTQRGIMDLITDGDICCSSGRFTTHIMEFRKGGVLNKR